MGLYKKATSLVMFGFISMMYSNFGFAIGCTATETCIGIPPDFNEYHCCPKGESDCGGQVYANEQCTRVADKPWD